MSILEYSYQFLDYMFYSLETGNIDKPMTKPNYGVQNVSRIKKGFSLILFVLRFYGPVNPMESCRARSVYLATRLLGRLSPLSS